MFCITFRELASCPPFLFFSGLPRTVLRGYLASGSGSGQEGLAAGLLGGQK